MGNVGRDAEVKTTNAGGKIANFSLATSEKWKDGSEHTDWHRVVIFNEKLADIAERFVKKGDKVAVQGKVAYRKYTNQSGQEVTAAEIVIDRFNGTLTLLGGGNREGRGDGAVDGDRAAETFASLRSRSPATRQVTNIATDLDDSIPF